MTEREKLIELIMQVLSIIESYFDSSQNKKIAELIADYLIENDIIVPPCKIGDTVYCIEFPKSRGIDKGTVYVNPRVNTKWFSVRYESGLIYDHPQTAIGKTVFFTYEKAEKALKERERNT